MSQPQKSASQKTQNNLNKKEIITSVKITQATLYSNENQEPRQPFGFIEKTTNYFGY